MLITGGAGISSTTGNGGNTGAGHGGTGGQADGQTNVGFAYGSYLQPSEYGRDGGYNVWPHEGGRGGGRMKVQVKPLAHTCTIPVTVQICIRAVV